MPASIVAVPLRGLVLASNLAGLLAVGWLTAAPECLATPNWLFRPKVRSWAGLVRTPCWNEITI